MPKNAPPSGGVVIVRVAVFVVVCAVMLMTAGPLLRGVPSEWMPAATGAVTSLAALGLTALFLKRDGLRFGDVGGPLLVEVACGSPSRSCSDSSSPRSRHWCSCSRATHI